MTKHEIGKVILSIQLLMKMYTHKHNDEVKYLLDRTVGHLQALFDQYTGVNKVEIPDSAYDELFVDTFMEEYGEFSIENVISEFEKLADDYKMGIIVRGKFGKGE